MSAVGRIVHQGERDSAKLSDWIAFATPDLENHVQNAVERVFKLLDLPRRADVEALNNNLQKVAAAVEALEKAYAQRPPEPRGPGKAE